MPGADTLDLGPVGVRGHDDTAGALHRLADEGGDALRPDLLDALLQPGRGLATEVLGTGMAAVLVPVGLFDVLDVRDRQAALPVHGCHAAEAGARHGAAVVGVVAADNYLFLRLAENIPVAAGEPHHGVVGLGAGVDKKHPV